MFLWSRCPPSDLDDLLQEVTIAIVNGLENFNGASEREFHGWWHRIASNKAADVHRGRGRNPAIPNVDDSWVELIEASGKRMPMNPGEQLVLKELVAWLKSLDPENFTLVWMSRVEEMTYGEIGDTLGVSENAVRMRVTRCLDKWRSQAAGSE